jgi:hypothetical protein
MTDRPLSTRDLAGADVEDDAQPRLDDEAVAAPEDEPVRGERLERDAGRAPHEEREQPVPAEGRPEATTAADSSVADGGPLLPTDQADRFRTRWQEIQTSFVDEPRDSVEQADALVADLMQRLAGGFSNERERLEQQWDRGDEVSTEDLRVVLTRYRSFFDRLLSA